MAPCDRTNIEVIETPRAMTLEQRVDAIVSRLDGIRVGEGEQTVDLGDLRP